MCHVNESAKMEIDEIAKADILEPIAHEDRRILTRLATNMELSKSIGPLQPETSPTTVEIDWDDPTLDPENFAFDAYK